MNIILSFLAKSVIISGLMVSYYQIFLRNKKFHDYNRIYLLSAMIASIFVPLLHFKLALPALRDDNPVNPVFRFLSNTGLEHLPAPSSWQIIFLIITIIISIFLLIILLFKILWIYKMKRIHTALKTPDCIFIETSLQQAPFSFLNNLFWRKQIPLSSKYGQKIFRHELAHISGKHTYDKLLSQIIVCFFWMNPFFWMVQKELTIIHEFIADSKSIEKGDTESLARILLLSVAQRNHFSVSHLFFNSTIKRRLNMISISTKTQHPYLHKVMALLFASFIFCSISIVPTKAQETLRTDHDAKNNARPISQKTKLPNELYPAPLSENERAALQDGAKKSIEVVFYLNGALSAKANIEKLNPASIKSMRLLKYNEALKKYDKVGKDGVVEFYTF